MAAEGVVVDAAAASLLAMRCLRERANARQHAPAGAVPELSGATAHNAVARDASFSDFLEDSLHAERGVVPHTPLAAFLRLDQPAVLLT